jgi:hypothetical protein
MYIALLLALLLPFTLAQYPPPVSNLTTIVSPVDPSITISYKVPPRGTCQTVFDSQQQYTGWVNIPGTYATNTFFWFIAARNPSTELTIWLNGGPGSSSMIGLFTENGPCEAIEIAQGEFGTIARDWGWDRASNILYIDQVGEFMFHSHMKCLDFSKARNGRCSSERCLPDTTSLSRWLWKGLRVVAEPLISWKHGFN